MTYTELQQRRQRIRNVVDSMCSIQASRLINRLLDDANPKLWSYHPFAPAKMTPKLEWQIEAYSRALSIAEKELGL